MKNFKFTLADVPKRVKENTEKFKNLLQILDKLPQKNKNYSRNVFDEFKSNDKNNFRAITYDRIIANALLEGKLRCYYLTCDEELFETEKIRKDGKKLSAKDKDTVLKMTAEYLLQRRNSEQEFIVLNQANMMNWFAGEKPDYFSKNSKKSGKIPIEGYVLAETKEKLFEFNKIEGINSTKLKLHPELAKHFRLIEDGTDVKWWRIFFSDNGTSDLLKEIILP